MRDRIEATVEHLRREFDEAFASPPRAAGVETIPLIALRVGGDPCAIRLLETGGLIPARKPVHVPSARTALLGITGLRGAILPVYSLGRLLGRDGAPDDAPWFLLCGEEGSRVALAFTRFEGHLRAPASDVSAAAGDRRQEHVTEIVSVDGRVRTVIDVRSLVAAIVRVQ